jgi:hypothetical protein
MNPRLQESIKISYEVTTNEARRQFETRRNILCTKKTSIYKLKCDPSRFANIYTQNGPKI